MMTYDFSPFYRSTIGFDRMAQLLEKMQRASDVDNGYPPYNIESAGEDHYRVTVAVAGFASSELDIEVRENTLHISGQKTRDGKNNGGQYLHQGIASRSFGKEFRLADHVKVENAWLDNGLLTVDLVRKVPEEMKPKQIAINGGAPVDLISRAEKLLGSDQEAA